MECDIADSDKSLIEVWNDQDRRGMRHAISRTDNVIGAVIMILVPECYVIAYLGCEGFICKLIVKAMI